SSVCLSHIRSLAHRQCSRTSGAAQGSRHPRGSERSKSIPMAVSCGAEWEVRGYATAHARHSGKGCVSTGG
ncbi:hypothetical protein STRIP9103_06615, partial [Streptomyces ipomoeae 91-03]